ncbi:hypothetical protein [Sciscionella marina]|uniref:mannitol dehydrogenase family protein n=1 Tax=Sciscionella marina TaxID=508770 RepID=UPI003B832BA8
MVPHLPAVDADASAYAATVLRRFANPEVPYSLAKPGADGSQKIRQRLAPTAVAALEQGHPPNRVAAVLASWIRWVTHCAHWNSRTGWWIRIPRPCRKSFAHTVARAPRSASWTRFPWYRTAVERYEVSGERGFAGSGRDTVNGRSPGRSTPMSGCAFLRPGW